MCAFHTAYVRVSQHGGQLERETQLDQLRKGNEIKERDAVLIHGNDGTKEGIGECLFLSLMTLGIF